MQFSDYQNTIFQDRYSKRDTSNVATEAHPDQMWRRVADDIATSPQEAKRFYEVLQDFHFVPGGRILSGAGTNSEKTYYNCYVIPVETRARRLGRRHAAILGGALIEPDQGSDSRRAIFDTLDTMVDIMSRGGGVGINWSVLRPVGSHLTRVSGTSSGAVGWMNVASAAVGEVEQGGSRRGAAMFMLNDWHPDLERFLQAKTTPGVIENANISVAVSNEFMQAVRDGGTWEFKFPDTTHPAYNTEWDGDLHAWIDKGYPVKVYGSNTARALWAKLAQHAHESGEPGVVFLDRYNEQSTANGQEKIICVNPCGEQGLGAYSVCNLGSMNLAQYVQGDKFDWTRFGQDVRTAIRFLDNVIDKTKYNLEETRDQQMKLRRIGLGVMGLADALILQGLRYGSSDAVAFTERIFATMKDQAIRESLMLAAERGPAGGWSDSMWERPFLKEFRGRTKTTKSPMRNLFLLTQAPTGTTAALAGVNGGIEPYFAFEFTRVDRTGTHEPVTELQRDWMFARDEGLNIGDEWVTSKDVTGKQHLLMQAAAQKWIDSSISKTVNLPKEASVADVAEVYDLAWDLGCKGLAVYRDGSRDKQVLYHKEPEQASTLVHHPNNGSLDNTAFPVLQLAQVTSNGCPSCGSAIKREEGCSKCTACSWSAC